MRARADSRPRFLARFLLYLEQNRLGWAGRQELREMQVYGIRHVTTYRYKQPVAFGEHRMMFSPREGHDQHLLDSSLTILPEPSSLRFHDDALGNRVGSARFDMRADTLIFDSRIRVALSRSHPAGFNIEDRAQSIPVAFQADELDDLGLFMTRQHVDPQGSLEAWARSFLRPDRPTPTVELLIGMINGIRRGLSYVRRSEKGIQTPAVTLQQGSGTCRDFTELMIEALRSLGLPARFVSGYLYVPDRDRHEVHGGGSTHAWVQVYLPGAGWIDIDPTNAILGNEGLIRVAVAREPSEALPLYGSFSGFPSDDLGMEVTVKVTREESFEAEPSLLQRA
jgi:transglutaminase-like putative cysteine protease